MAEVDVIELGDEGTYDAEDQRRVEVPKSKMTPGEARRLVSQHKREKADLSKLSPKDVARHQELLIQLSQWGESKIFGGHLAAR